jgi:hypothetical protein
MLDVTPLLPRIEPMGPGELDRLDWKGATAHIGPTADFTPLQKALLDKTNCALYLLYIGCTGFCINRTVSVLEQKLSRRLVEQIFCYQFDWRYPKLFGITSTSINDTGDRVSAIRRAIAFYFFEIVERMPSFFLSGRPTADVGFMVNLTRHLMGNENRPIFDNWVETMIAKMDGIAPFTDHPSPKLADYASRSEWEATVRKVHGAPLPLDVLDPDFDPGGKDLRALAVAQLNRVDAAANPLLTPGDVLLAQGFQGTPYRLAS